MNEPSAMPSPAGEPPPTPRWSLSRKAALLALAGVFAALCDILLARHMRITDYGTYRTVRFLVALTVPWATFGLVESLSYLLPRLPREAVRGAMLQTMGVLFLSGAALAAGLVLLRGPLAHWFDSPMLEHVVWLGALSVPLLACTQPLGAFLVCGDRVPLSATLGLTFSIIYASAVILAWRFYPTPAGALGFVCAGTALQFLIAVVTVLATTRGLSFRPDPVVLGQHWQAAWPLGFASLVGSLTTYLDQAWVGLTAGAHVFAIYWVGTAQMTFLKHVTGAVNNVMIPELSRCLAAGEVDRAFRLWHIAIRRMALLIFPIVACMWTLAGPLLDAVFARRYAESLPIFKIASITVIFKAVTFRALFLGSGRTQVLARSSVGLLIVDALLIVGFTEWLGPRGAALGVLVGSCLLASYFTWEICRMFHRALAAVYPWKDLARAAAISAAAGGVTWPLTTSWVDPWSSWTRCLLGGPAFLVVYVLAAWATSAIDATEWRRMRETILGFFRIR